MNCPEIDVRLFKELSRLGVSLSTPEDRKIQFPQHCTRILYFLEYWMMPDVHKPSDTENCL
jgi:hypothetical protein